MFYFGKEKQLVWKWIIRIFTALKWVSEDLAYRCSLASFYHYFCQAAQPSSRPWSCRYLRCHWRAAGMGTGSSLNRAVKCGTRVERELESNINQETRKWSHLEPLNMKAHKLMASFGQWKLKLRPYWPMRKAGFGTVLLVSPPLSPCLEPKKQHQYLGNWGVVQHESSLKISHNGISILHLRSYDHLCAGHYVWNEGGVACGTDLGYNSIVM